MPLSEREKKIFQEIEKNLYQEDPAFAQDARAGRPRLSPATRGRLGAMAFVVGFVALIAFFLSRSVPVGVVAFVAMVAGVVLLASFMKGMWSDGGPQQRLAGFLKAWEERARNRYHRP